MQSAPERVTIMASKFTFVAFVLLGASLTGTCRAQFKDGCKIETLRACGDDFVPYGKKTALLSSGEAFEKSCGKLQEQLTCSLNFVKDCMEGLTKAASTLVVTAFEEDVESICSVGSERNEAYVEAVDCMNSVGAKLNSCWKTFRGVVQKAVVKAPVREVIPYTCCSYHDLVRCADQSLTPCESTGGKEFALDLLQRVFGDAVGLICGKYKPGSEACKTLRKLPALGAKDRKVQNYVELLAEAASTIGRKN